MKVDYILMMLLASKKGVYSSSQELLANVLEFFLMLGF